MKTEKNIKYDENIYKKIEKSLKDIEEGRCRPIEEYIAEMEENYRLYERI